MFLESLEEAIISFRKTRHREDLNSGVKYGMTEVR